MDTEKTVEEWGEKLGEQMRALRLRINLDQVSLAKRAGIGLTAIKNLESGKGATLKTLIKALRVLDRADWLGTLAPPVSISPLQMLKAKAVRKRARKRVQKDEMNHGDT